MSNNGEYSIPYNQFAKIGFSNDMVDSLPEDVRQSLVNGMVTPIIVAKIPYGSKGYALEIPMKLQICQNPTGDTCLIAYPVRQSIDNSLHLGQKERELLAAGEILKQEISTSSGFRPYYLQLDPETKGIIKRKTEEIKFDDKFAEIEKVKNIQLSFEQKSRIREGKPIELDLGDNVRTTIGLDIRQPDGFKEINGTLDDWKIQKAYDYDLAHPEYIGLVRTDRNGWEYQKVIESKAKGVEGIKASEELERNTGVKI